MRLLLGLRRVRGVRRAAKVFGHLEPVTLRIQGVIVYDSPASAESLTKRRQRLRQSTTRIFARALLCDDSLTFRKKPHIRSGLKGSPQTLQAIGI